MSSLLSAFFISLFRSSLSTPLITVITHIPLVPFRSKPNVYKWIAQRTHIFFNMVLGQKVTRQSQLAKHLLFTTFRLDVHIDKQNSLTLMCAKMLFLRKPSRIAKRFTVLLSKRNRSSQFPICIFPSSPMLTNNHPFLIDPGRITELCLDNFRFIIEFVAFMG